MFLFYVAKCSITQSVYACWKCRETNECNLNELQSDFLMIDFPPMSLEIIE